MIRKSVVGRIMAPKNVPVLIARTCDYIRLHSTRELGSHVKLKLLIS